LSYSQSISDKAISYLESGKVVEAKTLLNDQVNKNNVDLMVFELLGDIASFEKNWDTAISYYKKLVVANPENANFNLKYGGALGMKALSVSRLQAVVYIPDIKKYLTLAAEQDRSQIVARRALVELYIKLPGILGGSDEKALMYANQLKDLSPVNAYLAKGFIIKENENIEEALVYYKNAFHKYRNTKGNIKSNSLNYELGKVAAELNLESQYGMQLLDSYTNNYTYKDMYSMEWVYLRKAQILANMRNKKAALAYIDKALTLKADFNEALDEKKRIHEL
jgi:tetratricopeptide (TPR) repeat protein